MKKQAYQKPGIVCRQIETTLMAASDLPIYSSPGAPEATSEEVLSKRSSVWNTWED
jgi:hypothetical protein